MTYFEQWVRAFLVTLAIEVPLYAWALRRRGFAWRTAIGSAIAANTVSHPLLWFVFPPFLPYALFLLAGESAAIAIETTILRVTARRFGGDTRIGPMLLIAAGVNVASTAAGLAFA